MLPTGAFDWSPEELAASLHLRPERVPNFFKDGRRVAWLLEELLADRHGLERQGECEGYDLKAPDGGHWEVRSCTKGGVYFCSSGDVGKGRKFDIIGYLAKQRGLAGWIVADIEIFPKIPYWILPKVVIESWHSQQKLGAGTKISRAKFLSLIQNTVVSRVEFKTSEVDLSCPLSHS